MAIDVPSPASESGGVISFRGRSSRSLLLMEIFVALSLSVAYCFLVSNFALLGAAENQTNGWVFSACSIPGFHLQNLEDVWKGRLSGLLLSGYLFDFIVNGDAYDTDRFPVLFGLYHACW